MHKAEKNSKQIKKPRSFFICIVLGVLLIVSNLFFLYLIVKENKYVVASQYPYIDFSRNFQKQEDYITNLQPLRTKIYSIVGNFKPEDISVYIEFLNTGANISVNQDTYIFPASLLKLPIAMTVMKKIENKEWNMNDKLVLLEPDINNTSGNSNDLLGRQNIGTQFTIEELLKKILIDSDNTAFNILFRNLRDEEVETFISATGLEKITDQEGKVSAKEYSRILRSLYTASYLNRENSQALLKWLDEATFNEFLSKNVSGNIPFPHKYGENLEDMVFSDSGIVYLSNRPYIISVMFQGDKTKSSLENRKIAEKLMRDISDETYKYFSTIKN